MAMNINSMTGWWQEAVSWLWVWDRAIDFFMPYAEKSWHSEFTYCSVRRCRELEIDGRLKGVWVQHKEGSTCENLRMDNRLAGTTESSSGFQNKSQMPALTSTHHYREQTRLAATQYPPERIQRKPTEARFVSTLHLFPLLLHVTLARTPAHSQTSPGEDKEKRYNQKSPCETENKR